MNLANLPDIGRSLKSVTPRSPKSRLQVLIVEDVPINQKVVRRQVQALGHSADLASSGEEALKRVETSTYDVILMDCYMPGMGGFVATRRIRDREAEGERVTIVGITGAFTPSLQRECLEAGMDRVLAKPVTLESLGKALSPTSGDGDGSEPASSGPARQSESAGIELALDPRALAGLQDLGNLVGRDLLSEVVGRFLQDAPVSLAQLAATMENGKPHEVEKLARALKRSAGNLGALELTALLEELENRARQAELRGASELLAKINREMVRVCSWLEEELERGSSR